MRLLTTILAACLAALALLTAACGPPMGAVTAQSPRYATVAAEIGGRVYVAGGIVRIADAADVVTPAVEAYDPDDGSWTRGAPMPTARAFSAAAVHDGKLYVFGGIGADGKTLDVVEAFDPWTNSWTSRAPMRVPRSRCAATLRADLGGIVVAGGLGSDSAENARTVHIYFPAKDEWLFWPDLPRGRHALHLDAPFERGEAVFAVGGYDDAGAMRTVEEFGPGGREPQQLGEPSERGYRWRPAPSLAHARGFFGLARIGALLYAVGGRCPTIPPTEVLDVADVDAGWKPRAPLPKDLCRFSMVAWKGRLLVFGGETEFGASVNTDVLEYDPADDAWSVR